MSNRVAEDADQRVDCLLITRRFDRPCGHLRLVGYEEVVEMPHDEFAASRLLHDDVDDVLAVEATLVAEERLLAVIVVFRPVLELPGEPAVRRTRDLGLEGPAGEGTGRFADVNLGVIAGAEAEQLEQLTAPVLIDRGAVVLLIIEPEDHGRVGRHLHQKIAVVAHSAFAKDRDLLQQLVVIVDLGVAGREDVVPEQRHLLFQRPLGVD